MRDYMILKLLFIYVSNNQLNSTQKFKLLGET
jgi:hypothetical protein